MAVDLGFKGSIPALFDRFGVPMLFAPYAGDLAARVGRLSEGRVLETAAGTGVVTRALLAALPEAVRIVATDLSQAMLDHAASTIASGRITWQQADAQALPFPDGSFDAVVCQFGVMFFPDKAKAFAEAYRVLRPGGSFLFSVWDRIEANELTDVAIRAVAARFPDDPPTFMNRTPHGHYDVAPLARGLRGAGFAAVASEPVERRTEAPDARAAATFICQGSPLSAEIEARDPAGVGPTTDAVAAALAARFGDGPVSGRSRAIVVTAIR
ncbi:MAG: class I SAM-dependent methyltransferase [Acetobacteraceae bacterium]|nr:class I SAM-dependent methyltransferase [Acetobacteraceae bacterium]